MSTQLRRLAPSFRPYAEELYRVARQLDRTFLITSTRRTHAEQARLWWNYQHGNSKLPAAPPGHSMHERGLAIDIVRPGRDPFGDDVLRDLGAAWVQAGGVWHHSDPVHFAAG